MLGMFLCQRSHKNAFLVLLSSFLLFSFLLYLLAFGVQKLRKRMTKAKKTMRKSLAFARRYYKRLSIIDLQTEKEGKEKNTFS